MLVEFSGRIRLFKFVGLQQYLEEILGARVDLAMPGALREQMKEQILREAVRAA